MSSPPRKPIRERILNPTKPVCINFDGIPPMHLQELLKDGALTAMQAEYAKTKLLALAHRHSGKIQRALHWEEVCETIYNGLPEELKW